MGSFVVLVALVPCVLSLSPLPRGLGSAETRSLVGVNSAIRKSVADAVGRALNDGQELLELEFPPLLERKTFFDDFADSEELDANRDFGMNLAVADEIASFAPGKSLWLCFPDEGEMELALKAWPGKNYQAATVTYISGAVEALGREALIPIGKKPFDMLNGFLRGSAASAARAPAPAPALQFVIQPGNNGPMEDWYNLERLKVDGIPMICLNGAFDKVTSGYYSNFLNPDLAKCSDRFISRFEQVYYLKPISKCVGWLYRVYGEPWQLYRATKDDAELVETYEERPSAQECVERLRKP